MKNLVHKIPIQYTKKKLIVPIQFELNDTLIEQLKSDLFTAIAQKKAKAVVFDMRGIEVLDEVDLSELTKVMRMVNVLGLNAVLCGLSPGVVATIITLNIDWGDLCVVADLDDAHAVLKK